MRLALGAAAIAVLRVVSSVAAATTPIPQGLLPDTVQPLAYRLDLTVLPEQERFSGHAEIDVTLNVPAKSFYLHGRDLNVTSAVARVGAGTVRGTYAQVDPFGVARLDFGVALPAGKATLAFDYDAPFGSAPSGLFHAKVGEKWYAWTKFEPIDARAAFPSFDQPGYKTPFTVSLTTTPGSITVSNAPEAGTATAGELVRHTFETTKPLPTYLVAFMVGPFAMASGTIPPTPERPHPLPVRIIATQPNKDRMDFALENTGPIVALLEKYFGRPFPFPKLDQIASPVMLGAMENAGAVTYGDVYLLLDKGSPTRQLQEWGTLVAHELSHQWFGDLVTPRWWDDLWLKESFANWMGYRVGNEWRPDLKIDVSGIDEAFYAMGVDSLKAGRPIHQQIETNGEISAAYDGITYGKGGQVVAMMAAYLGDEKFRAGVRLYLERHAYGTATTDDFFGALAEVARDERVLTALKSFVDQQGLPVVRVERVSVGLAVSQKRYALFGTDMASQVWTIPVCLRVGGTRQCTLLDKASATIALRAEGTIMPNAAGTGYYRFSLPEAEWRAVLAEAASLPPGEALAAADSLWGGFSAGDVSPALLIEAARLMAGNPDSGAVVANGQRLAQLRSTGLVGEPELPGYRNLLRAIYAPKLAELGFDPKAGAYASEDSDRQKLRSDVVSLLAREARDKDVRERLAAAAAAYLAGNRSALDESLFTIGFEAHLAARGEAAASDLFEKALASDDAQFRDSAVAALGRSGESGIGRWLIARLDDNRLRPLERFPLLGGMTMEPATREMAFDWIKAHYDALVKSSGTQLASFLPIFPSLFCSVEKAAEIEAALRPKVVQYRLGALTLDRSVEQVSSCGVLKQRRGAEIVALFH